MTLPIPLPLFLVILQFSFGGLFASAGLWLLKSIRSRETPAAPILGFNLLELADSITWGLESRPKSSHSMNDHVLMVEDLDILETCPCGLEAPKSMLKEGHSTHGKKAEESHEHIGKFSVSVGEDPVMCAECGLKIEGLHRVSDILSIRHSTHKSRGASVV